MINPVYLIVVVIVVCIKIDRIILKKMAHTIILSWKNALRVIAENTSAIACDQVLAHYDIQDGPAFGIVSSWRVGDYFNRPDIRCRSTCKQIQYFIRGQVNFPVVNINRGREVSYCNAVIQYQDPGGAS